MSIRKELYTQHSFNIRKIILICENMEILQNLDYPKKRNCQPVDVSFLMDAKVLI